jgi:hypothetical protein
VFGVGVRGLGVRMKAWCSGCGVLDPMSLDAPPGAGGWGWAES